MKHFFLLVVGLSSSCLIFAQKISRDDKKALQKTEDSLIQYSVKLVQGSTAEDRFKADSSFTKMFVRALKINNSFYYPFDSLQTISKLCPPDSAFRIFTWQMVINENLVRQHGAIQMRTADGALKLFPLIDKSDVTLDMADTFANNKGWIGAVYYKIIETQSGNKPYYTLLGYDENNINSNRKIIEVMTFSNDEPVFGGRLFSFEEDSVARPSVGRYIMEYKKNAGARLNYDNDLGMIIFEHLESESNQPTKKWTLIPDGDYEGFKWKNGKWIHINKVFNQVTAEGMEPVPSPVKDAQGNTMEEKLQNNIPTEQSEEATPAATKQPTKPKTKPVATKKKTDNRA